MSKEKPTLSDWIAFLSAESNAGVPNLLSAGAFVLAAWAALYVATHNNTISFGVAGGVSLLLVSLVLLRVVGRRAGKAQELLDGIMSGTERDLLKIEWEWEYFSTDWKKKTKKRGQEIVPATKKSEMKK